jgi:predicted lipoprotein with Yx(FWY)xxD motif
MPPTPTGRAGSLAAVAATVALTAVAVAIGGTGGATGGYTLAALPGHLTAARVVTRRPPVIRIGVSGTGRILATTHRMALYTYLPERADHRVHCVGACVATWPPLRIAHGVRIARRVPGLPGAFGTVRRPDGAIQLTRNGLPLYGFVADAPGTARGKGVGGFRVVRS